MSEEDFFGNENPVFQCDDVINIYGNYKIRGDIELVGKFETEKIKNTLHYNHTKNQFFLFKEFQSGKCHIDFFLSYENIQPGLLFDKDNRFRDILGIGLVDEIAFSISSSNKNLYFDYSKNVYVITHQNNGNVYTHYFQQVKN
jgi:hypothetical protein